MYRAHISRILVSFSISVAAKCMAFGIATIVLDIHCMLDAHNYSLNLKFWIARLLRTSIEHDGRKMQLLQLNIFPVQKFPFVALEMLKMLSFFGPYLKAVVTGKKPL